MQKLLELLRDNLDGENFTVDHPRRTLEEFFLDVIARAKAESVETAGVVGGGKIAEYLAENEQSSELLNSLISDAPVAPAPAEKADAPAPAAEKSIDEKLDALTADAPAKTEVANVPPPADEEAAKNLDEADAKLGDLLGKNK